MSMKIYIVLISFTIINACNIEVRLSNAVAGKSKIQVQVPGPNFDKSVFFTGPTTKSIQVNGPNCGGGQWKITAYKYTPKTVDGKKVDAYTPTSDLKTTFDGNGYVRIMIEANFHMWVNDRAGITCSGGQCA
uniref:Lipoprotein n=1 Tax=Rhabditophanes sp. KR3021 TaxID=114890 RepID=A0AC35TQ30_9BILA